MDKNELMGELYVLRAGLSTVSGEKDKIDRILNKTCAQKQELIKNADTAIENAQSGVRNSQQKLTEIKNEEEKNEERANVKLGVPGSLVRAILLTLFMALSLSLVAYIIVLLLVDTRVLKIEESPVLQVLYGWSVSVISDIDSKDSGLRAIAGLVFLVVSIGSLVMAFFAVKVCIHGWFALSYARKGLSCKNSAKKIRKSMQRILWRRKLIIYQNKKFFPQKKKTWNL